MNDEAPAKTIEAERFDAAMRRALERYDRLSGPGARLHDYVPLKTLEREECIYAIRDALAQRWRVELAKEFGPTCARIPDCSLASPSLCDGASLVSQSGGPARPGLLI